MKPEQRATRDETHDLKMPRQGVSFLNDMLGLVIFVPCIYELDDIQCQMCNEGCENTIAPTKQAGKCAASYDAG